MIVQCQQCMAKYRLDESRIPGDSGKVKCSRCQHMFLVSKESPSHEEPTMLLSPEEEPEESAQQSFQESLQESLQESSQESFQQSSQESFQCPNCGFQQPPSQDCIKCGIVFSKYRERAEATPPPYFQDSRGHGLDKDLLHDQAEGTHMTYAGFWSRFGAYFIDGIIAGIIVKISMSVMMFPLSRHFSSALMSGNPQPELIVSSLSMVLVITILLGSSLQALYFILMWGYKGATLGKMAMRIKIVSTKGSDISYGTAFLRYIGTMISGMLFCLGYLWMLWDDKKQTWHDKIASTCVIRTQ